VNKGHKRPLFSTSIAKAAIENPSHLMTIVLAHPSDGDCLPVVQKTRRSMLATMRSRQEVGFIPGGFVNGNGILKRTGAIFLDRDGVINENRADHVKSWAEFQFIPGALESIRALTETGLPIFVVTNQATINRKLMSIETLNDIHCQMTTIITQAGGAIAHVYHCPHDDHEECDCRKPKPGMILQAAKAYDIDLSASFMVGDAWTDMKAGLAAGVRNNILVMTGRGSQHFVQCLQRFPVDFHAACDLDDATTMIKSVLAGDEMSATPRMRSAFHMGFRTEELLVL
jgi:D-glycero-D-manno-heptose 1,7-bisphosphate phosphatase